MYERVKRGEFQELPFCMVATWLLDGPFSFFFFTLDGPFLFSL